MDERFAQVDQSFRQVDQRFDRVEGDIRELRTEMHELRIEMNRRFDSVQRMIIQVGGGMMATMVVGFVSVLVAVR